MIQRDFVYFGKRKVNMLILGSYIRRKAPWKSFIVYCNSGWRTCQNWLFYRLGIKFASHE